MTEELPDTSPPDWSQYRRENVVTMEEELRRARRRPGFMDRLSRRMAEDRSILDRLRDLPELEPRPTVVVPWPEPDCPTCRHCGRNIELLVRRWIHLDEWEASCGVGLATTAEPNP